MPLNFEKAKQFEGKIVRFQNQKGQWVVGKVLRAREDGFELEEFSTSEQHGESGYGYGFWGRRPFYGPRPFYGRRPFYPYAGAGAFILLPFLFF